MSLLLDALKRAEQEKLSRQGEASNDAAPAGGERPRAAPALELQPLSAGAARGEEPAHAAQVLFDAKALAGEKRSTGMLWATLAAIGVLVASAAAYVWYQIRVLSPSPPPVVARRLPPPPPQMAAGSPPPVAPDVSAGYAALRDGNLAEAHRRYEAALAADPASLDAHLGLATAEARAGNATLARAHYRAVLELDSRNATALAGLAALAGGNAPEAVESQLREDVARVPESAPLRFALGSHYAAQHRWGEAQAVFFEAYRLEPENADVLYNLAVSLDHMRQRRLAADFYRRAIEAAQGRTTQFDPAPVRRRLAELTER